MGQPHNLFLHGSIMDDGPITPVHLSPEVLQHIKALHLRVGEPVRFLDGRGRIYDTVCENLKPFEFRVLSSKLSHPLLPNIELCLAPPRGDALKEAITQASEIGVGTVRFLRSDFVQYARGQEAPTLKSQRVSDAACEQCGRAWRCEIHPDWHELSQVLTLPGIHVVADEALSSQSSFEEIGFSGGIPALADIDDTQPLRLYIGPEGGWSERERHIFDGHATRLALGSLILRVPTAIVAATHFLRVVYWHTRSG